MNTLLHVIRTGLGLLLLSLGLALMGSQAHAKTRVLLLEIEADHLTDAQRQQALGEVQKHLKHVKELQLVGPPKGDIIDLMMDLECIDLDLACLARMGAQHRTEQVLHIAIDPDGGAGFTIIRLIDVEKTRIAHAERLPVKGADTAVPTILGGLERIFNIAGPTESPPPATTPKDPATPAAPPAELKEGTLVVETSAKDAAIMLGQELLGIGKATKNLPPGDYTLRITAPGKQESIAKVTVIAGQSTRHEVALSSLDPAGELIEASKSSVPTEHSEDEASDSTWIIWTVVGVAVAAGVVTAILLATQEDGEAGNAGFSFGTNPTGIWRDPATHQGPGGPR